MQFLSIAALRTPDGSSAISRSGSAISATAMQMRWRMPPACGGAEIDREPVDGKQRLAHRRSAVTAQPRVDHVAHRLAEEGEAEGGKDQRQAAGNRRPGRILNVVLALVQDRAPGGGG